MKNKTSAAQHHLGRGLDSIYFKYRDVPKQAKVIDLSKITPDIIPIEEGDRSKQLSKNYAEFLSELAVSAGLSGSYLHFSGSLEASYSMSTKRNMSTKFFYQTDLASGFIASIGEDIDVLKKHLTPQFKKDINNPSKSPRDIIEIYGTHVVVKAHFGGMAEHICHERSDLSLSESEFAAAAEAKFETAASSVKGNTTIDTKQRALANKIDGNTSIFVRGGDAVSRQRVIENTPGSYIKWAASVDNEPAFLNPTSDGLIPLYKLANNQARRDELKSGYYQSLAEIFKIETFESGISGLSYNPKVEAQLPKGYKLLSGGGQIINNNKQGFGVLLTASYPSEDGNGWRVEAREHHAKGKAQVKAFAMGIYDPEDIWENEIISVASSVRNNPEATCSLKDKSKVITGGGSRLKHAGHGNLLTGSVLSQDRKGWRSTGRDHLKPASTSIRSYVIGLKSKVPGVILKTNIRSETSTTANHPSVRCKVNHNDSKQMVGGGAWVHQSGGSGNLLTSSYPIDDNTWYASSKDHVITDRCQVSSFGITLEVNLAHK